MTDLRHCPLVLDLLEAFRRHSTSPESIPGFERQIRLLDSRYFIPTLLTIAEDVRSRKRTLLKTSQDSVVDMLRLTAKSEGRTLDDNNIGLALFPLLRDNTERSFDLSTEVSVERAMSELALALFLAERDIAYNFELATFTEEELTAFASEHPLRHIFPRYVSSVPDTTAITNAIRQRVTLGMNLSLGCIPKGFLEQNPVRQKMSQKSKLDPSIRRAIITESFDDDLSSTHSDGDNNSDKDRSQP